LEGKALEKASNTARALAPVIEVFGVVAHWIHHHSLLGRLMLHFWMAE